ncbi:hypothetical transcript [Echinococcus multilocularis]|uniref:Hypothetical transcript n=1 Tax=Echinococcus multilocularis TaxID=6211 RepID=A0A068XZ30_ECHMU|nr:hypothetical transcript [Echinococcus multilocularis]
MNLSSSKQSFTRTRHGSLVEFDPKIQLMEDGGSRRALLYEDRHYMQPDPELLDLGGMDELVEGGDLEMSDYETPSSMGSVSALRFSPSNSGLTDFDMLFDDGSGRYLDCEKETKSMKRE